MNKTYFHTGNPLFREKILKEGLIPQIGECYQMHYSDNGLDCSRPYIFLCSGKPYNSCYDDDIYEVTLSEEQEKLLLDDPAIPDGKTFRLGEPINPESVKLIYRGTGTAIQ